MKYYTSDNVLVTVGFYLGHDKKNGGALPFVVLCGLTVLSMIISEIVAKRRKKAVQPIPAGVVPKPLISNLISFTSLNLTFAFGIFVRILVTGLSPTVSGLPFISIQTSTMLFTLLLTNNTVTRRLRGWCGFNQQEEEQDAQEQHETEQHGEQFQIEQCQAEEHEGSYDVENMQKPETPGQNSTKEPLTTNIGCPKVILVQPAHLVLSLDDP